MSLLTDPAGLWSEQLSPLLSVLLVHDHVFSKNGIAAPSAHPLRQAVERHKARLHAEFTKSRLRRKCATVDELKAYLYQQKVPVSQIPQPRWVRINKIKCGSDPPLESMFPGYHICNKLDDVLSASPDARVLHVDHNIADLVALPPQSELVKTTAYKAGHIILQDKASCFPARLLLGDPGIDRVHIGDVVDACAAPGNKTSHLACICAEAGTAKNSSKRRIFACERDAKRSTSLLETLNRTGLRSAVDVLSNQDFLALNPSDDRFRNVTHLLVDPSCSGSGIVGREDIPVLALPIRKSQVGRESDANSSRKRKRKRPISDEPPESVAVSSVGSLDAEEIPEPADTARLERLSNLQTKIVEHALKFPDAHRVTYSTCSIHHIENEMVVARVLASRIARERGWRILRRHEQVARLQSWVHRGIRLPAHERQDGVPPGLDLTDEELDACIRCVPGTEDATMGFFLCGFVREQVAGDDHSTRDVSQVDVSNEDWEGFSDT